MVADMLIPFVKKGSKLQSVVENWEEVSENWGGSRFAAVYPYSSRLETLHEHFSG
jgi:hypothetical protein